ncbi:calcium-activated chloride channel regulator 3A-1-like [Patiria miniata]|uniref:VWFA domain-containing protein n=1 Tax=Patiria miniata TaxID=46514 RepID=A0A914AC13_PATMI|nr:calcium-activated chloride channel regulator 3A-1-like [Patiria miniata]
MSGLLSTELMFGFIVFLLNIGPNLFVLSSLTRPETVELIDNGYAGVVVSIHEDVPENMDLVSTLESMFSDASQYLYQATKHRAFFRNVTIVVPRSWAPHPDYGPSRSHHHDVIVTPTNQHWAPDFNTNQYQGCGEGGVSVRVGVNFLLDPFVERHYGPVGRLFVHEWGHYRLGLFEEYPDPATEPDVEDDYYHSSVTGRFQGISCSSSFAHKALRFDSRSNRYWECAGNDTVGYEEGCAHVTIDDDNVTQSTGSIMYGRQFYDKVVNFCASDGTDRPGSLHDKEAPTRHNRLCGARSCWDVMKQHTDFQGNANPPRDVDDTEIQPRFNLVQARGKRVVLLIDTSSSMQYDNRFQTLHSAAAHFIQSVADIGSHVGIVQYNEVAHVCSWLVRIRSESDRQALLDSLPVVSGNFTSRYSQGLLTSLQVLSSDGTESAAGGIVIMFADGSDSDQAATDNVVSMLVDNAVVVDTVAATDPNPKTLPDIAAKTGGRSFHYQANRDGLASVLYHAFAGLMVRSQAESDQNRRIMISSHTVSLGGGQEQTWNFSLDESVGRETELMFTWTERDSLETDIVLISPSGAAFNSTYPGYQNMSDFKYLTFSIQGTAETGQWEVHMRNLLPSDAVSVMCIVTSHARSDDVEPILITPMLSSYTIDVASGERLCIYVEVCQGLRPVVGARVIATIYPPGGHPDRTVELLDNGAGADVRRGDGVYSRYYVNQPNRKGFNTVQVTVTSSPNTTSLNSSSQPRNVPNISPDDYAAFPRIGNFTIFAPGTQPRQLHGTRVTDLSRHASGFTAYFTNFPASPADLIPPSRIHDLRVVATQRQDQWATVTLSWTATGEDADSGTASRYDIRYSDNVSAIADNFDQAISVSESDVLDGNLTKPLHAMNTERFTIRVPLKQASVTSSMTFALKAADSGGQFGELSNVARATFRMFVPEPASPSSSTISPFSTFEPLHTTVEYQTERQTSTVTVITHRSATAGKGISTLGGAVTATTTLGGAVTATTTLGGAVTATTTLGGAVTATTNLGGAVTAATKFGGAVTTTSTSFSTDNYSEDSSATISTDPVPRSPAGRTLYGAEIAAIAVGALMLSSALVVGIGYVTMKLFLKNRFGVTRVSNGTSNIDELPRKELPLEEGPLFDRMISTSSAYSKTSVV